MAVGIPDLSWINIGNDLEAYLNEMPGRMRLDSYEVSWERRTSNALRFSESVIFVNNDSANSDVVDLSSSSDTSQYSFAVTMANIDKGNFSDVTTLTVQLQARENVSSDWRAVQTKATTGTPEEDATGFQFDHLNADSTLKLWRLQVTTSGNLSPAGRRENLRAWMDVSFVGNQRRRVINAIGTVETTAQSAYSSRSEAFLLAASLVDPIFYIAPNLAKIPGTSNPAEMIQRRLIGTFKIDRISIDRGDGRTAQMTLSITQEGAWADE